MAYKAVAEERAPSWGDEYWQRLHSVLGLFVDTFAEGAAQAVRVRFLSQCPADALDYHATERGLERGAGEATASFRTRLRESFEAYRFAGTEKAIEDQLAAVGFTSTEVYEAADWYPLSADWWRFWVVIDEPHGLTDDAPKVGAAISIGAFTVGGLDPSIVDQIRRVIRKWKPAHAKCVNAIVAFDTSIIGTGWVVGAPVVGGSAAYISV